MKKSQLRKIIRESIKELMTEQITHDWSGNMSGYLIRTCDPSTPGNLGSYALPVTYQVGDVITGNFSPNTFPSGIKFYIIHKYSHVYGPNHNNWTGPNNGYNVQPASPQNCTKCCDTATWGNNPPGGACFANCPGSTPCTSYGCTDQSAMNYNSTILPNCDQGCVYSSMFGCTDSTASNYDPVATVDDGSCITTSSCDQSAWSNYSNWLSTFTSLPNFTSTNPNQPCQFLCQKETQLTNQIPTVGPNWANQLQCKLDEIQILIQQNNCASSNASAC